MPPHRVGKNVNPVFRSPVFCHWIPMPHLHTAYFFPKQRHNTVITTTYPGVYPPLPFKNGSGDPFATDILAFLLVFVIFYAYLGVNGCIFG